MLAQRLRRQTNQDACAKLDDAHRNTHSGLCRRKPAQLDRSGADKFPSTVVAENHGTRQANQTPQDTRWGDRTLWAGFLWEVKAAEDT